MVERMSVARLGGIGDGIADTSAGPVYVAGVLPGEIASVEREGDRATLVELESVSLDRITPFCPYYGRCGGCVAQHVGPGLYGRWKSDKIATALARVGVDAAIEPLVDAGGDGRRRVTFHGRIVEGRMRVGFMEARSHRLIAIDACPITVAALREAPRLAEVLAADLAGLGKPIDIAVTATLAGLDVDLRGTGPLGERRRQRLIDRATELDLARLSSHGELLIERRPPAVGVGRSIVMPPPGSFLQATAAGESILADAVGAALSGARRALDLFSGIGPFTLRLADTSAVHAVDSDRAMLAALDGAARNTSGLRTVTTEVRDLFRRPLLAPELDGFDGVVLDPPRSGAEAQVRQLALSSLDAVVMVSCDPGTFARDARTLVDAGFKLRRVLPVDQFKWSTHLEIVGEFRRPVSRPSRKGGAGPAKARSGIEPRPIPAFAGANEADPVVQAKGPVLPELDRHRSDAEASPIGRARDLSDRVLGGVERDRLLERETALERARLLAGPSADPAVARAAGEVGVRLGVADPGHGAAHPHLPAQALPVHDHRRLGNRRKLPSLGRVHVGVEHEAVLVRALEEHHADVRKAFGIHGRERHRGRVVRLGGGRLLQPGGEQPEGLVRLGELTGC